MAVSSMAYAERLGRTFPSAVALRAWEASHAEWRDQAAQRLVDEARQGQTGAAQRLLLLWQLCLERGVPAPGPAAKYLASLLSRINAASSPWKRPLLTRRTGKGSPDNIPGDKSMAAHAWWLWKEGRSQKEAWAIVARERNVSVHTVERVFKKYRAELNRHPWPWGK